MLLALQVFNFYTSTHRAWYYCTVKGNKFSHALIFSSFCIFCIVCILFPSILHSVLTRCPVKSNDYSIVLPPPYFDVVMVFIEAWAVFAPHINLNSYQILHYINLADVFIQSNLQKLCLQKDNGKKW